MPVAAGFCVRDQLYHFSGRRVGSGDTKNIDSAQMKIKCASNRAGEDLY
jgi:hypothetical protein